MLPSPRQVTAILGTALALQGCSIDDVDVAGKRCTETAPCPGSYSCVAGRCQLSPGTDPGCVPKFEIEGFRRQWDTPNTLRWAWTPVGAGEDFVQYKVVLGTTETALEQARISALAGENDGPGGSIWTQDENPELGQYELGLSQDTDLITATTTDGLLPGTEYRARLLAYDATGCVFESSTVVGKTRQPPFASFALFDDSANPGGSPRPSGEASFVTDPSLAYDGDRFISWPGWPDDGSVLDGEYQNVGLWSIATTPDVNYPLLDFSAAYLELAVAIDGPAVAAWGELRLIFGPSPGQCGTIQSASLKPYVFRPGGEYSLVQVPLDQLRIQGEPLDANALDTRSICEVSVGRSWAIGESVRLDELRLRW